MREIAKVLIYYDGSIHIAFGTETVLCTNHSLMHLFSDPFSFIENDYQCYTSTTDFVNKKRLEFTTIQAITLATITEDKNVHCKFPELFTTIFENVKTVPVENISIDQSNGSDKFSDTNQYFLHLLISLLKNVSGDVCIKKEISNLPAFHQEALIETLNLIDLKIKESESGTYTYEDNENGKVDFSKMMTSFAFAKKINESHDHVKYLARSGQIPGADQDDAGNWFVPIDAVVTPQKKKYSSSKGKKKKVDNVIEKASAKGIDMSESYTFLQSTLNDKNAFSPQVRIFMRTIEEANYYIENNYKEVKWDNKYFLICDVPLDYYSEELGKTNAELIKDGKSPVVPGKKLDDTNFGYYELHHCGQKLDSPLAILPAEVHRGKETNKIFHLTSAEEDLHEREYELTRKAFWNEYLAKIKKYKGFENIPSSVNNK